MLFCGEFPSELGGAQESVTLTLPGHSGNGRVRSKNIGLSANYLADYISAFVGSDPFAAESLKSRAELRDTVSFIANELLENAVKYNADASGEMSLRINLTLHSTDFVLVNTVHSADVEVLHARFAALLSRDPAELYLEHMEQSAAAGDTGSSGLGLLTMLHDYGARLSWRIELPEVGSMATLTTVVQVVR